MTRPRPLRLTIIAVLCAAAAGIAYWSAGAAAESPHVVPAPAIDAPASSATSEVAVLAGGCFWGVQGVFQHVDGVTSAVSGYAGGAKDTADYETVGTGST